MPKIAISTQTYRHDIDECALLCESISRFVPDSIDHFIFVNDEDYGLFVSDPRFARAKIHRKSELLPKTFFKLPFRLMSHKCYVSPATIPVRQWIAQQICKLAVFDVINDPQLLTPLADYDRAEVDAMVSWFRAFLQDYTTRANTAALTLAQ